MSELGQLMLGIAIIFTAPVVAFVIAKFITMGYYAGRRSSRRRNTKQRKNNDGNE